jgi:hypothetical protein
MYSSCSWWERVAAEEMVVVYFKLYFSWEIDKKNVNVKIESPHHNLNSSS